MRTTGTDNLFLGAGAGKLGRLLDEMQAMQAREAEYEKQIAALTARLASLEARRER